MVDAGQKAPELRPLEAAQTEEGLGAVRYKDLGYADLLGSLTPTLASPRQLI